MLAVLCLLGPAGILVDLVKPLWLAATDVVLLRQVVGDRREAAATLQLG